MTDYLTTDTELTSIANAIRTKGGTSSQLVYPTGFVSAIEAIPTGGGSSKTVTITLTNPKHKGDASSPCCIIYDDDGSGSGFGSEIGRIESPSGSTTVTTDGSIIHAAFFSASTIYVGYITSVSGAVRPISRDFCATDSASLCVASDGAATIDKTDYDF